MKKTIDERLDKINDGLDILLGNPKKAKNSIEWLINFGFTVDEAKAFIKREPNYVRRKVTDDESDDKVTEP
jgi:hypothetical protein